jgi:signal transduction histidine kinase
MISFHSHQFNNLWSCLQSALCISPRLFSKFATKSFDGTGLGLYISKSIVEAHGGGMWAENNKNGEKGAAFYFSLPLRK